MRPPFRVSVIGGSREEEPFLAEVRELGRLMAREGWTVVCGGLGGVMEAIARGARESGGEVIGILPGPDPREGNPWLSTVVATGLGQGRNLLVVMNGDAVVARGGKNGTLSEIGHALALGRRVFGWRTWELPGVERVEEPRILIERLKELFASDAEL